MEYLQQLAWPGNIRELENSVQRLIISAKGEDLSLMDVMHETHSELFEGGGFGAEEEERALPGGSYPIDVYKRQAINLKAYGERFAS